jgi:hypothetical protein
MSPFGKISAAALAWIGLMLASGTQTQSAQSRDGAAIEQTEYWGLPGQAEEVFQWRLHACDVREKIGLPRGRVFKRQGDSKTLPDVVWQVEYPNEAARRQDLKTGEASPEFKAVRDHMNTLTSRFERAFWLPN